MVEELGWSGLNIATLGVNLVTLDNLPQMVHMEVREMVVVDSILVWHKVADVVGIDLHRTHIVVRTRQRHSIFTLLRRLALVDNFACIDHHRGTIGHNDEQTLTTTCADGVNVEIAFAPSRKLLADKTTPLWLCHSGCRHQANRER